MRHGDHACLAARTERDYASTTLEFIRSGLAAGDRVCCFADKRPPEWAVPLQRDAPGADRLLEYENRVGEVFAGRPAAALCHYDLRRFDRPTVEVASALHTTTLPERLRSALLRVEVDSTHRVVSLAGEVDLSNRLHLRRALETLPTDADTVHVDLSHLRFIDLGGAEELAHLALQAPGRRVVLRRASPALRRLLDLFWPGAFAVHR